MCKHTCCMDEFINALSELNVFVLQYFFLLRPTSEAQTKSLWTQKMLKKKEEKGKIKKNVEIPKRSTKCVCCSRSMKSYWADLGAVSAVKSLCFLKHTREQYIWAHAVDREKDKGRKTEGASYIWGSRPSSLTGDWENQALRKHLASACVADTAAPLRVTHGLRLAARKAHGEC